MFQHIKTKKEHPWLVCLRCNAATDVVQLGFHKGPLALKTAPVGIAHNKYWRTIQSRLEVFSKSGSEEDYQCHIKCIA